MWKQKEYDKNLENEHVISGVHKLTARLLAERNIKDDSFVKGEYKDLSHPYKLKGIKEACEIFIETIKSKGNISVIGDYDCDGIISSVMLYELCRIFKLKTEIFLPSRLDHGYGLTDELINYFFENSKTIPDLLFITDCGMNSKDKIKELKGKGVKKIIIIDHHEGNEESISYNADVLVNWHLSEGSKEMCACGEVYQFIRAMSIKSKKIDPIEFLLHAAIGTIADVSPLIDDNRIIVKNGLKESVVKSTRSFGFLSLFKKCNMHVKHISQDDIGFKIAPRINAMGRLYKPDIVFKLLVERDMKEADKIAKDISDCNDERKKIQKQIEKEANKQIENGNFKNGIFVYGDWHVGVVGIVASRLVDTYDKPVIVIGKNKNTWKGSGRSIEGFNLVEALKKCEDSIYKYGGHAAAVGLTMKEENLEEMKKLFDEVCIYNKKEKNNIYYDASLNHKYINKEICAEIIKGLQPFCKINNPEPVFLLKNTKVVDVELKEGTGWNLLKVYLKKGDYKIPYLFKTFNVKCGTEIQGRNLNILFKFPQKINNPSDRFFEFSLDIVDLQII